MIEFASGVAATADGGFVVVTDSEGNARAK
jgi:hypothetical protein